MAGIELAEETWVQVREAGMALASLHSAEVDEGIEPRRKFELDGALIEAANNTGALRIYTARLDNVLIGYCTWNVSFDAESKGLLIATQGAWFMHPSHVGSGTTLFEASLNALKRLGVKCVFPHHRTQGRGAGLERYFLRLGATRHQVDYTLWIGD